MTLKTQKNKSVAASQTGRKFSGALANTINSLNEYACWCFFNDDHGRGKGKALDGLDEVCKVLHDGYECAMRDAEEEGRTCIPWEVDYIPSGLFATDIGQDCEIQNPGSNCAARACAVEGSFVANMLDFFIGGGVLNDDYRQSNGFNFDEECGTKGTGKGNVSSKSCCGRYPDRFPFKTLNGDRACCGARTYNALSLKCCDPSASEVKFNC